MTEHLCKICRLDPPKTVRPVFVLKNGKPAPGPRCATHHRAFAKAQKARSHEKMVQRTYGLPPGHYEALYGFQGKCCAICQRATGTGKRKLAVDHDHESGEVRGLLCQVCNYQLLGQFDIPALKRAIAYLIDSPYEQFLREAA